METIRFVRLSYLVCDNGAVFFFFLSSCFCFLSKFWRLLSPFAQWARWCHVFVVVPEVFLIALNCHWVFVFSFFPPEVCVFLWGKKKKTTFWNHTYLKHNNKCLLCWGKAIVFPFFVVVVVFQSSVSHFSQEFTRPVLREQLCIYTLLLTGMTFNNNNNRRCLDLLGSMATGIKQKLLFCW